MREIERRVGPKPTLRSAARVTVRLLAQEQHGRRAVAPQPEVEGHAADHRHDRVDHLRGEAGELHDRHRLAARRQPERWPRTSAMVSPPTLAFSNMKGEARIVADGLDARDQPVIRHAGRAVLELAHALVEQRDHVRQPIRHRRVDGIATGLGVDLLDQRRSRWRR